MHLLRGRAVSTTVGAPCRPPHITHNAPNVAVLHSIPPHIRSESSSESEGIFIKVVRHNKPSQSKADRYMENLESETKNEVLSDDVQTSRELLFSLSMYRPLGPLERYADESYPIPFGLYNPILTSEISLLFPGDGNCQDHAHMTASHLSMLPV